MIYLTLPELLHAAERTLGSECVVRDHGLLAAALARPQATVFGVDAYASFEEKAAALLHSLARNQALADGNTRLSLAATLAFLGVNGRRLTLTNDEAYRLIMDVASGALDEVSAIADVLRVGSEPRQQWREWLRVVGGVLHTPAMTMREPRNTGPDVHEMMGPLPASPGCDCHICRPDDAYDDFDRGSIDAVLRYGWQVLLVSDDVECCSPDHEEADHHHQSAPAFAYTMGLGHRCGHPELLMSGLPPELMASALNAVADRVMRGRRLSPGDVLEDVLGGVPVVVERVARAALDETVRWSGWFHRREPEALMIVWPTTSGIFSWQPGAPDLLDELQPRSWREPFEHGGALAVDPDWPFPVPAEVMAFSCVHVVDERKAVLWVARQSDPDRGEDWSLHCGADGHSTDEMRLSHIAHLVRAAPSVRELADLPLDHEAWREGPDSPWQTRALPD